VEGGGRFCLSLDTNVSRANISKVIMKKKDKIDLLKGRTKEWDDYNNRPSIQSSYQIVVCAGIGLVLLMLILIVSEVV